MCQFTFTHQIKNTELGQHACSGKSNLRDVSNDLRLPHVIFVLESSSKAGHRKKMCPRGSLTSPFFLLKVLEETLMRIVFRIMRF